MLIVKEYLIIGTGGKMSAHNPAHRQVKLNGEPFTRPGTMRPIVTRGPGRWWFHLVQSLGPFSSSKLRRSGGPSAMMRQVMSQVASELHAINLWVHVHYSKH